MSAAGAKLVFGDNLYAYGPVDGPLTEDLTYRASGPHGRTRARIADDLMIAHQQRRVRATIGRGSDFFGPHAHQSTVGDQVFARAGGQARPGVGRPRHPAYGHLHRGLRASVVTLGDREKALGEMWHVPNAEAVTTRRFVEMVFASIGPAPRLRTAPGWGLALAGLFNPTIRAVREQLYQSERPWVVDSGRFERTFGWTATPLSESIDATTAWFRERSSAA